MVQFICLTVHIAIHCFTLAHVTVRLFHIHTYKVGQNKLDHF